MSVGQTSFVIIISPFGFEKISELCEIFRFYVTHSLLSYITRSVLTNFKAEILSVSLSLNVHRKLGD